MRQGNYLIIATCDQKCPIYRDVRTADSAKFQLHCQQPPSVRPSIAKNQFALCLRANISLFPFRSHTCPPRVNWGFGSVCISRAATISSSQSKWFRASTRFVSAMPLQSSPIVGNSVSWWLWVLWWLCWWWWCWWVTLVEQILLRGWIEIDGAGEGQRRCKWPHRVTRPIPKSELCCVSAEEAMEMDRVRGERENGWYTETIAKTLNKSMTTHVSTNLHKNS